MKRKHKTKKNIKLRIVIYGLIIFFSIIMMAGKKTAVKDKPISKDLLIKDSFSLWDGSHKGLTKHIKSAMHHPDSYEHVETRYRAYKEYMIVFTSYRGTNAYGAIVKNTIKAKTDLQGNVLAILNQ